MLTKGKKDLIIVPYDFTEQSDTALIHASKIALQNEDEVRMLHIINNETGGRLKKIGKEKKELENSLKEIALINEKEYRVKTTFHTEEGSIFTNIGSYIDSCGASLAVMGTHGVRGLQHIIGANSLKVIGSSKSPFVIVQKRKINDDGYKRIVVPIDGNKKGKNKIVSAIALAKYFNSTIYIFEANSSDKFVSKQIAGNLNLTLGYIKDHKLPYEKIKEIGKGSFSKQLIRYSAYIDADLIVISSHHDNEGLMDFLGKEEVNILNNDPQIAVLCVNPAASVTNLSM